MANQHDDSNTPNEPDKTASAARRPDIGEHSKRARPKTGAGQEARRGVPPGEHAREHQSQYGGGGTHGGAVDHEPGGRERKDRSDREDDDRA